MSKIVRIMEKMEKKLIGFIRFMSKGSEKKLVSKRDGNLIK